jgi:hypothetical protein
MVLSRQKKRYIFLLYNKITKTFAKGQRRTHTVKGHHIGSTIYFKTLFYLFFYNIFFHIRENYTI